MIAGLVSTERRTLLLAAGALVVALGCGTGTEAQPHLGSVRMALTASNGATTYRLSGATFDISGAKWLSVTPDRSDAIFKVELPAGDYTIALRDGWTMQTSVGGAAYTNVDAALAGPASQTFSIFDQEITTVKFSFKAGPDVFAFGDGELELQIGVNEGSDPTACSIAHPSCGVSTVTCGGPTATFGNTCTFGSGPEGTTITCNGATTTIPSGFGSTPSGYAITARRLADLQSRLVAYFAAHGSFPVAAVAPTPAATCCAAGGISQCPANPAAWHGIDAWDALGFSIDVAHPFVYSYVGTTGDSAHIVAEGDLDCDAIAIDYTLDCTATNGVPSCTMTLPTLCSAGSEYE
ncbi:MAG: hypothetical protein JST92_24745 [Deltaproteobacteria bacterium]|nr:hypothetical protein [Deltaproteobacteria bacterium]